MTTIEKPTHIAIYCHSNDQTISYLFKVTSAKPKKIETHKREHTSHDLVHVVKIPARFKAELTSAENWNGDMLYVKDSRAESQVAISQAVYPKAGLSLDVTNPRILKGFGYFLEAITSKHLRDKFGFTHIRTTYTPSSARIDQLKKINLPIRTPVAIDEWIKGHLNGVRITAKELRK